MSQNDCYKLNLPNKIDKSSTTAMINENQVKAS